MAITVDWGARIITVPVDFLTPLDAASPPMFYELDVNALRLALKALEDDEGMPYLDTHQHNAEVLLGGVVYARTFEVINGYRVLFDDSIQDHYTVNCTGANHNVADVKIQNSISLIVNNAAGLVLVSNADDILDLADSIEPGLTLRQALRLIAAAAAGVLSGAETTAVAIRNVGDSKTRISATVDAAGNRSAVVVDTSDAP